MWCWLLLNNCIDKLEKEKRKRKLKMWLFVPLIGDSEILLMQFPCLAQCFLKKLWHLKHSFKGHFEDMWASCTEGVGCAIRVPLSVKPFQLIRWMRIHQLSFHQLLYLWVWHKCCWSYFACKKHMGLRMKNSYQRSYNNIHN